VTEEPAPSTTLQPAAWSMDSMRAHSIFPLTGSANTFWRVLRCDPFTEKC
jgi:putative component of membrane protein insertase Oxa1/YidC/SpoIIIJ protein YidD